MVLETHMNLCEIFYLKNWKMGQKQGFLMKNLAINFD